MFEAITIPFFLLLLAGVLFYLGTRRNTTSASTPIVVDGFQSHSETSVPFRPVPRIESEVPDNIKNLKPTHGIYSTKTRKGTRG